MQENHTLSLERVRALRALDRERSEERIQEVIDSLMKRADSAAELADQKTDPTDKARCRGKAMAYSHAAELVVDLLRG